MNDVKPPRGRPRSESAQRAVLAATRDLLRTEGYDALNIADIAKRAGVGRQTVYRWWPSKAMIVADCVLTGIMEFPLEMPSASGDCRADLEEWLASSHSRLCDPATAPLVRALTAAAATDPGATDRMADLVGALRNAVGASLRAGEDSGTIRQGVNGDAVVDLLVGGLIYAVVTRDKDAPARSRDGLAALLGGIGANSTSSNPSQPIRKQDSSSAE